MHRRSVAFCRGINVGGHRATKHQLIAPVAELGYDEVDTLLASGNILFRPNPGAEPDGEAMAAALEAALGFGVPVTIRTADELSALAEAEPFAATPTTTEGAKPQVILLFDRSPAGLTAAAQAAERRSCDDDLLVADPDGGAVHWLPVNGISGSGLDQPELLALFGVHTVRTANTVRRLLQKA
ncbi:MAG: DUF1697 domain-containing protein [Actinomycetota bacterium]